jgi:hypothetical protein
MHVETQNSIAAKNVGYLMTGLVTG